jgi:hypothetical protein
MNKRILLVGLAGLLVALLLAGTAGAQTSASFDLSWYVLAGGRHRSFSSHYAMTGTVGESTIGSPSSASYGMQNNYWQSWPEPHPWVRHLYLPLVMKSFS